jgi:hypothetical protein
VIAERPGLGGLLRFRVLDAGDDGSLSTTPDNGDLVEAGVLDDGDAVGVLLDRGTVVVEADAEFLQRHVVG